MKLDMIGIIVADMSQSILFYQRLGFETVGQISDDYVELNNTSLRISLNSVEMITNVYGKKPEATGDKIELAFLCESATEVNQQCSRMADYGYELYREPWDAFWGQRYGIIKDPNGNLLALFANLLEEV